MATASSRASIGQAMQSLDGAAAAGGASAGQRQMTLDEGVQAADALGAGGKGGTAESEGGVGAAEGRADTVGGGLRQQRQAQLSAEEAIGRAPSGARAVRRSDLAMAQASEAAAAPSGARAVRRSDLLLSRGQQRADRSAEALDHSASLTNPVKGFRDAPRAATAEGLQSGPVRLHSAIGGSAGVRPMAYEAPAEPQGAGRPRIAAGAADAAMLQPDALKQFSVRSRSQAAPLMPLDGQDDVRSANAHRSDMALEEAAELPQADDAGDEVIEASDELDSALGKLRGGQPPEAGQPVETDVSGKGADQIRVAHKAVMDTETAVATYSSEGQLTIKDGKLVPYVKPDPDPDEVRSFFGVGSGLLTAQLSTEDMARSFSGVGSDQSTTASLSAEDMARSFSGVGSGLLTAPPSAEGAARSFSGVGSGPDPLTALPSAERAYTSVGAADAVLLDGQGDARSANAHRSDMALEEAAELPQADSADDEVIEASGELDSAIAAGMNAKSGSGLAKAEVRGGKPVLEATEGRSRSEAERLKDGGVKADVNAVRDTSPIAAAHQVISPARAISQADIDDLF